MQIRVKYEMRDEEQELLNNVLSFFEAALAAPHQEFQMTERRCNFFFRKNPRLWVVGVKTRVLNFSCLYGIIGYFKGVFFPGKN